jgi:hypothetical protein
MTELFVSPWQGNAGNSDARNLYAFDFDQTIVSEDSEYAITTILGGELPDNV